MDKWFRNNNVLKLVALLIGTLLWTIVHFNQSPPAALTPAQSTVTINNVALTTYVDEKRYEVTDINPQEVDIVVTGRLSLLSQIRTDNYTVYADLRKLGPGTHQVPIAASGFPSGVQVNILPSTVTVKLDEMQKKEMPVKVVTVGDPAEGYKAGIPIIQPTKVHVTASSSRLKQVDKVVAEIPIGEAYQTLSQKVPLKAFDALGNVIDDVTINPEVVKVDIPITSPYKPLPLQMDIVALPPKGFAVSALAKNVDKVTVYGPQGLIDSLDFYAGPPIDLSNLTDDSKLVLDIPKHTGIISTDPKQVEVSVTIVPSITKTYDGVPIDFNGLGTGLKARIISSDTNKMPVDIEGAPSVLAKTSVADLQAFVDLTNLAVGQHEVEVNWNLPLYLRLASPLPQKVTVEITQTP